MIEILLKFVDGRTRVERAPRAGRLEVAAAALLVEMARADGEVSDIERARILKLVRSRFGLSPSEAEDLVAFAEHRQDQVFSEWIFTETVRARFSPEERLELLRHLFEIALADDVLTAHEAEVVARIGEHLGLSPADILAAHDSCLKLR